MSRILALSRIDSHTIRCLCLNDSVDINKARLIMSKISYPCFNINIALECLSNFVNDLFYVDFNSDEVLALPIINCNLNLKVKKCKLSSNTILDMYNPFILDNNKIQFTSDLFYYKSSGWLVYKGILLCNWKSFYKDNDLLSHMSMQDNILNYQLIKPMYILIQGNARHRPVNIGESMFVNLSSFNCSRSINKLGDTYYEVSYCFDRVLREWVKISESVPMQVLGRKSV